MKDTMFAADIDDFDSDFDEPDPDILYRIINAPIPKFPELKKPKWFGIPDFNLQWRRLKRRKWLLRAIFAGIFATIFGFVMHFTKALE